VADDDPQPGGAPETGDAPVEAIDHAGG
jgi:hypothetical protein